MSDEERQLDELEVIESIYPQELMVISKKTFSGCIKISPSIPREEFNVTVISVLNEKSEKKSFNIKYLPPIELYFMCPPDYPSTSQPHYMLHCLWLPDHSLSEICNKLDALWDVNKSEIIFVWASFLKEDVFSYIKLDALEICVNMDEIKQSSEIKNDSCSLGSANTSDTNNDFKFKELHSKDHDLEKIKKNPLIERNQNCNNINGSNLFHKNYKKNKNSKRISDNDVTFKYETPKDIEKKKEIVNCENTCGISSNSSAVPGSPKKRTPSILERIFKVISIYGKRPQLKHFDHDTRIVPKTDEITQVVNQLQDYNDTKLEKEFRTQIHSCGVCFDDKPGSQCVCVKPCRHAFCKDCVREYLTLNIAEAKVKALRCLDMDCETIFNDFQIRQNVDDVTFDKYRKFSLKLEIENDPKLLYCPRKICQSVARVTDLSQELGYCQRCGFYFCLFCKKAYHGVQICDIKNEERIKVIREYQEGNAARKAELEKRFTKNQLIEWINSDLTEKWIRECSKPCPNCGATIEKDHGCNKMTCYNCNIPFCWLCNVCLSSTQPYKHFLNPESPCYQKLFPAEELIDDEEEIEVDDEEELRTFMEEFILANVFELEGHFYF